MSRTGSAAWAAKRSFLRSFRGVCLGAAGVWPAAAVAQFQPYDPGGVPTDLGSAILGIVEVSLLLVGVLALGFIVYGGFRYMTARGDEREVEEAKNILTYSVIGIVVIGLAFAIVRFVFQTLGA